MDMSIKEEVATDAQDAAEEVVVLPVPHRVSS